MLKFLNVVKVSMLLSTLSTIRAGELLRTFQFSDATVERRFIEVFGDLVGFANRFHGYM